MSTAIKIRGLEIGRITPHGRYLDKAALLALRQPDRIAAYLALIWPGVRTAQTIARVCQVPQRSLHSITRALRSRGVIRIVRHGHYVLAREGEEP